MWLTPIPAPSRQRRRYRRRCLVAALVGGKSDSQLVASSAPVRQKNTDVPSGAATAARSASAGPFRRGSTGASSACARAAAPTGSSVSTPSAATAAPGRPLTVRGGVQQHPCPALLPQLHRFGRVLPGVAESERPQRPGDRRSAGVVDGELGERETAQRRHRRCGRGFRRADVARRRGERRPGCRGRRCRIRPRRSSGNGNRPRVDSCSASSDRSASTAARWGSDCRKTSLNTSSDNGPVYPAVSTWPRNAGRSNVPWPGNSR